MTLTAHISVACAVGIATGDPVAGFFAGLLSHHIIDGIPHSDAGSLGANVGNMLKSDSLKYVIVDIALAFIIFVTIFIKYDYSPTVFWAAAGGTFPDALDNSPFWSQYTRKIFPTNYYHRLHETVHFTILSKKYFWVGIVTQAILVAISLYFIF